MSTNVPSILQQVRDWRRARGALVATAACASVLAMLVVSGPACITTSPPELPAVPPRGPRILADGIDPPSFILLQLPPDGAFQVPVEVSDPTRVILGRVFIDYYPAANGGQNATQPTGPTVSVPPALDGGVTLVSFQLTNDQLGDPSACHVIQFFVADSFAAVPMPTHAPGDSLGADSVTWFYTPGGPGVCNVYDAGVYPDAAPDGSFVTPGATN